MSNTYFEGNGKYQIYNDRLIDVLNQGICNNELKLFNLIANAYTSLHQGNNHFFVDLKNQLLISNTIHTFSVNEWNRFNSFINKMSESYCLDVYDEVDVKELFLLFELLMDNAILLAIRNIV